MTLLFGTARDGKREGSTFKLILAPVPATEKTMDWLEERGVIRRILPGRDSQKTPAGTIAVKTIYNSHPSFGSHKLIAVTVNQAVPTRLTAHPDREDFLLIGDALATAMILTVSLLPLAALQEKIASRTLDGSDLLALLCRMNDPQTSFFTMNPEYPHAETCIASSDTPPSFYVSEPSGLPELHVYLAPYTISFESKEQSL